MRLAPGSCLLLLCVLPLVGDSPAQQLAEKDKKILQTFADEFVSLTPGKGKFPATFEMGSSDKEAPAAEKPATKVTLSQPFAIARYEVTQELYELIMGNNPSRWRGRRNSVEMVNWDK